MENTMKQKTSPSLLNIQAIADELFTVCDFVRYAVSRFNDADLFYGHGTDNAMDEAIFMVLESLKLPIDSIEPYWNARLMPEERKDLVSLIHARIETRNPASYLLNKAYIQGYPFYVDERVIVPRSFIAEILCSPEGFSQIDDYSAVENILDLCTGSGCLAILAAQIFPNARVDAVDLSKDALEVAARNVRDYGLEDRVILHQGNLFTPLKGKKYDLIITNPPYVDQHGMSSLPPEFRHEPEMALAAGDDGLDIVHRILKEAGKYLKRDGGLLCELGRCGPALEEASDKPFLWVGTENSTGEVFWLTQKDL